MKPPDAQSEDTKSGRDRCETMTLGKEDMPIYGHCPAQDDFYLVVCSHCGKLVKPQAFKEHCDQRHSSLTKICVPPACTPLQKPRTSRPSSHVSKEAQRDSRSKETGAPSSQRKATKLQKESASLPAVDKVTQDKLPAALPQRPRSQPPSSVPALSNHCRPSSSSSVPTPLTPSPVKPSVQKPTAAQTSSSPQRETRTYSRLQKNTKASITNKKSEDQERKKLSAQEPTQTHKGKPDSDLRTVASSPRDSEPSPGKTKAVESHGANKETSRCSKISLNAISHIARSKEISETFPEEDSPVEVEVQPPYPFNQSLPLSDDSDNDEQCNNLSTTAWHPKPLGLCTFGCRAFGCSVFTFDRRLHHLRIALSTMLDDHVNSHLWKKMPQPASTLRSAHATPSVRGSPVRPGTGSNQTGSFSVKSTSLERLKNTQMNCRRTKSPPSVSPTNSALGQQGTSVGQTSKAYMEQKELMQSTKLAQKNTPLSHSTSSKHIVPSNVHVSCPLSKKTSPLRPSERNTPVLNEFPPPKPPRSKGRSSRTVQPRAGATDDRTLAQKRKPQSTPAPSSSSPSKKCSRLSPPSRSSLFSWKRDSTQDVWLGVWRKEHTSEDDTSGQY